MSEDNMPHNNHDDKGICYIVGAGECRGLDFMKGPEDFVISADGGLAYLERYGQPVDLLVGDFDSLEKTPNGLNIVRLSKEKDETDTFAAVQEGIKRGYTRFHLYGGTGGRIDHTIANIQLLAWLAERKLQGFLFANDFVMTAVTDGSLTFPHQESGYVSVFSLSENSTGVYLRGLKYPLDNATVTNTFPIGVSNEFTGKESSVHVEHGTLLVVYPVNE
jgi:thiamine pyrophosphokinase